MTRGFRVFPGRRRRSEGRAGTAALVAILAGVAVMAAARPARAQMTQAQKDEVKLHYQRATRAYDLQKYQEAIDEKCEQDLDAVSVIGLSRSPAGRTL